MTPSAKLRRYSQSTPTSRQGQFSAPSKLIRLNEHDKTIEIPLTKIFLWISSQISRTASKNRISSLRQRLPANPDSHSRVAAEKSFAGCIRKFKQQTPNCTMIAWKLLFASLALASAYTQPTSQTWGPLYPPNTSDPVTQGEKFNITWANPQGTPTRGVTVSLVLCKGPSTNCVLSKKAIVEGIPAGAKHYVWNVVSFLHIARTVTSHQLWVIIRHSLVTC